MTPAVWPRAARTAARMLHIDPVHASFADKGLADLPNLLRPGDLVVMNDAATLPASLGGRTRFGPVELRLTGARESSREWTAVLFGGGSWRQRTEDRPSPPVLEIGDDIELNEGLTAKVVRVSRKSPRLVDVRFNQDHAALWAALYRAGRPVQYSYLCGPLALWHVQTACSARPWAAEMPSAGWAITAEVLREMRRQGIEIASLTHAAGLSSTGDRVLDAMLPLAERFDIPDATVRAVALARSRGGRVIAVGTTVVRALEGSAAGNDGVLRAGEGLTDIRIGSGFVCQIVDGLFTGLHEPGTSHFDLLTAFAPLSLLEEGHEHARVAGYQGHEFGDTCLILD